MSRPFHVLSVPMLCVFHITHKSRLYMLQKDTNWFVEVFNRTRSSVEIYVFPQFIDIQQRFMALSLAFPDGHFGFLLFSSHVSFLCVCSFVTFLQKKAPPSQVHVLPFVLVKFLFPVDYCFWICFLESLDLLGSLSYFSKFSVSCST